MSPSVLGAMGPSTYRFTATRSTVTSSRISGWSTVSVCSLTTFRMRTRPVSTRRLPIWISTWITGMTWDSCAPAWVAKARWTSDIDIGRKNPPSGSGVRDATGTSIRAPPSSSTSTCWAEGGREPWMVPLRPS